MAWQESTVIFKLNLLYLHILAVSTGTLENGSTLEDGSKMNDTLHVYATLNGNAPHNNIPLDHINGALNGHVYRESSRSPNGASPVYIPSHYEQHPYYAQRQQLTTSLEYWKVGDSLTEKNRAPQDYALPVSSKHSTMESQPYEVPVNSLPYSFDTKV